MPSRNSGIALFWDEHAEMAAHGAALANDAACSVYVRELAPEAFYKPRDQGIAAAIHALHQRGDRVDAVTVAAEIGADAAEKAYLHTCAEFVPSAAAIAEYAAVVNHNARCRYLRHESIRAQEALANGNGEGETRFREILTAALERRVHRPARSLQVVTAPVLAAMSAERVSYVVQPYLARGNVTQLAAIIKGGKTHFALDMVSALLHGSDFVGHATERCPVLYLTEQGIVSFRVALRRAGVLDSPDLHVLLHREVRGLGWPEICEFVHAYVVEHEIGLVIVDTLSHWAALPKEGEKDEATARETVAGMLPWTEAGCAVLAIQHERKGGGEIGESARGSTGFGGAMDILLALRRDDGDRNPNRRRLAGVTRLDDDLQEVVLDLVDGHYVMVGEVSEARHLQTQRAVIDCLPTSSATALDLAAIVELSGVPRTTTQRLIAELRAGDALSAEKRRREDGRGMREVFWMGDPE